MRGNRAPTSQGFIGATNAPTADAVRAAVFSGAGQVRVQDVREPSAPQAGELLLKVTRAAICGTDSSEWAHGPLLTRPPVVLGHEFAGRVVAAGDGVDGIGAGDRVVSGAGISCGACDWCRAGRTNLCSEYRTLGLHTDGGLAEYVLTPAAICRTVPAELTDEAAAMAQPLAVALHAVRRSGVASGQSCVVIGVGGIGAFIVAAVVARGAGPVVAIDVDDDRLANATGLGADRVLDARERDLSEAVLEAVGAEGAHVVIEASGAPHAPAAALASARRGGRVVLVGLQAAPREIDLTAFSVREVDVITTLAHVCHVDLPESLDLLSQGDVADTVLDRVIDLEDLVEHGIKPLAAGEAKGKIVVAVDA